MPTVDILATVYWSTLTRLYKCSLIKPFCKGYHGMLPRTLAEELIVYCNRSSSRLTHELKSPTFASKYVQNSISNRGVVLCNAIGRSNGSILECANVKTFLKNVIKQIINDRSDNFIYF